jgi:[amino group carrier protein]-6-phospho-L-2-aminoadipate/5-phospho-L-glutamate reductase
MKRFKASVIGGSGYGGGEMIRRLLMHPEVELVRVASIDRVGERLGAVHPNLEGRSKLTFENLSAAEAAAGVDVVLLGLPHKVTAAKVAELWPSGVKIVDLSGDFRLRDAGAYERYYGAKHPHPSMLEGSFVYGLPEVNRDAIRKARAVASPGCFATTIELGLLPLARAGLLEGEVETVGITGSSGSGAAASAGTHHPVRSQNLRTYKPLDHQHVPEVEQLLAAAGAAASTRVRFVPVSAPLSRGIFVTSFVRVRDEVSPDEIKALYAKAFEGEPFVRVPEGRLPEVAAVAGSNYAEVGVQVGPAVGGARLVTCFSALDNLIKGGAGQGIQNMNLVLGLDERLSLEDPGGYP